MLLKNETLKENSEKSEKQWKNQHWIDNLKNHIIKIEHH